MSNAVFSIMPFESVKCIDLIDKKLRLSLIVEKESPYTTSNLDTVNNFVNMRYKDVYCRSLDVFVEDKILYIKYLKYVDKHLPDVYCETAYYGHWEIQY